MTQALDQREADQLEAVPAPEFQTAVIGHEEQRTQLMKLFDAGRLPSGILLHGPRGIGKATLAFDITRAILTLSAGDDPELVRTLVAAGSHPNLRVLRRKRRDKGSGWYTVIRVEDVRKLREEIRLTRGRKGHRVVIIDSVDDCNASAANALLKILEEPPPDTTFFLISHRPAQLLPTIRSRTLKFALRPLSDSEVAEILRIIAPDDAPEPAGVALEHAVALGRGRPRRAIEALQLGDGGSLSELAAWLADPLATWSPVHTKLAETIGRDEGQTRFARDMVLDWIATEAKQAAEAGRGDWRRLASANDLWEKATTWFSDVDALNVDARQTLVVVFDAIRAHLNEFAPMSAPERQ